ncbi:hypothetical protein ACWC2M_02245 [Streptomyces sp. NPDC001761]
MVSTSRDRPANATTTNGVTWIDWGPTDVTGVLLRNMLPARDVHNAVQNTEKGENSAPVMGAYYPQITYCSKESFAEYGPDTCRT